MLENEGWRWCIHWLRSHIMSNNLSGTRSNSNKGGKKEEIKNEDKSMSRRVHLAATLLLKAFLTDSREAAGNLNRSGQEAGSKVEGHVTGDASHLATVQSLQGLRWSPQHHTVGDVEHSFSCSLGC